MDSNPKACSRQLQRSSRRVTRTMKRGPNLGRSDVLLVRNPDANLETAVGSFCLHPVHGDDTEYVVVLPVYRHEVVGSRVPAVRACHARPRPRVLFGRSHVLVPFRGLCQPFKHVSMTLVIQPSTLACRNVLFPRVAPIASLTVVSISPLSKVLAGISIVCSLDRLPLSRCRWLKSAGSGNKPKRRKSQSSTSARPRTQRLAQCKVVPSPPCAAHASGRSVGNSVQSLKLNSFESNEAYTKLGKIREISPNILSKKPFFF